MITSSYRSRFTNIPEELFTYLDRLFEKPLQGSAFHQAMRIHPEATFRSLNRLFRDCEEIVSLTSAALLKKVDFNKRDLSPERIESLLGELRTIVFLNEHGFTDIVPIRAKARKSPDFSASYGECGFVVEVVTSPQSTPRVFHDSVVKWAKSRLGDEGKLGQVRTAGPACLKMFVIVMNSSGAVALNQRSDYLRMLDDVWQALKAEEDLFLALVTGGVSFGEGPDDCIFPSMGGITRRCSRRSGLSRAVRGTARAIPSRG